MKFTDIKIFVVIFIICLFDHGYSYSQISTDSCKSRLPESINSYQPAILPVITIDSRVLYFDRKLHPDNVGGINDLDDIWFSEKDKDNNWSAPKQITHEINTENSDVLFSITPYGRVLLYGTKGGNQSGFSMAVKTGNLWGKPVPLKIDNFYNNSENFFGFLSADGKILILSLDRKDGRGKLDLYVCFRKSKEYEFTEPKSMGDVINTKQNEGSPFLAYDNKTLYFTSQGHPGFGGKDIFMSRRLDDSWQVWSKPINLGKSINTSRDENSVCLTALGDSIVYTSWDNVSTREGIYFACLPDSLQPSPYIVVRGKLGAFSEKNKNINSNSRIIVNYDRKQSDTFDFSDKYYALVIDSGEFVSIIVSKDAFQDFGFSVNASHLDYSKFVDYNVSLKEETGNNTFLTRIHFDYDSDLLNDSALSATKKVMDYVIFPKETRLLIVGHTDKSGTDEYNMKLSMKRAETVAGELLKYGFDKNSLKIVAKGKSEPVSENDEENRRVEIFIIDR